MTVVGLASPKVAVVVPVYNPGPYLKQCVAVSAGADDAAG